LVVTSLLSNFDVNINGWLLVGGGGAPLYPHDSNNRREGGRDFFLLSLFKYIFYNNTHTHTRLLLLAEDAV